MTDTEHRRQRRRAPLPVRFRLRGRRHLVCGSVPCNSTVTTASTQTASRRHRLGPDRHSSAHFSNRSRSSEGCPCRPASLASSRYRRKRYCQCEVRRSAASTGRSRWLGSVAPADDEAPPPVSHVGWIRRATAEVKNSLRRTPLPDAAAVRRTAIDVTLELSTLASIIADRRTHRLSSPSSKSWALGNSATVSLREELYLKMSWPSSAETAPSLLTSAAECSVTRSPA